ncbi:hypothetical protein F7725_017875 [Dissostichus mawsoni]|uniref:Peptidase C2 calpain domain-containing protein n=1 Tax=Dissostichus mawsoni TaxID=36200 RepID=A0A7J5XST0_DISMA|nr:hypothetical protein F7725_017875 [Dissostichus mawsoni]
MRLTSAGTHTFTLVVSQYEKQNTINYTLRYSVGFEMVTVSMVGDPGPASFQKKNSGDYRCGFCYMEAELVPAGLYNVIPTTFLPKQEGPFFLDFSSTSALKVSQLQ